MPSNQLLLNFPMAAVTAIYLSLLALPVRIVGVEVRLGDDVRVVRGLPMGRFWWLRSLNQRCHRFRDLTTSNRLAN